MLVADRNSRPRPDARLRHPANHPRKLEIPRKSGAKLGEKDRIICWFQPKGSQTYHVVYGDLSVKDVKPEELPLPVVVASVRRSQHGSIDPHGDASLMVTVPSQSLDAIRVPSGLKTKRAVKPYWPPPGGPKPRSERSALPLVASHNRTTPSIPAVARRRLSGLKVTEVSPPDSPAAGKRTNGLEYLMFLVRYGRRI